MTEEMASTWAQAFFEYKNLTGTFMPGTFADLNNLMDTTFKDVNLQAKAAKSLLGDKFDIDIEGLEGFFASYEIFTREANIIAEDTNHDVFCINNLNRLVPSNLKDGVNLTDPIPRTYARYK